MKMKVPMDIGGCKGLVELDGDALTMTLDLQHGKKVVLEIDDFQAVMDRIRNLTGRAAWELKGVVDELLRRLANEAIDKSIASVVITVATVEALLQRIFPEAITQPAEVKK